MSNSLFLMIWSWMVALATVGLFLSSLSGLFSFSWFYIWLMLEVNMLSFVSLVYKGSLCSVVASVKYFIVQSLSSSLFLMFLVVTMSGLTWSLSSGLLLMSMCVKLGYSPFHSWFISCVEGLTWQNFFLISTIQKLLPFYVLSMVISPMFGGIWLLSLFVSVLGSLGQCSLRKLLAYSSINHMCWMGASLLTLSEMWAAYLLIYSLVVYVFCMAADRLSLDSISQMMFLGSDTPPVLFLMSLFSLAGLPPFLGVFGKLLLLKELSWGTLLVPPLLFSSLIMCYIYVRIAFPFIFSVKLSNSFSSLDFYALYSANTVNLIMVPLLPLLLFI